MSKLHSLRLCSFNPRPRRDRRGFGLIHVLLTPVGVGSRPTLYASSVNPAGLIPHPNPLQTTGIPLGFHPRLPTRGTKPVVSVFSARKKRRSGRERRRRRRRQGRTRRRRGAGAGDLSPPLKTGCCVILLPVTRAVLPARLHLSSLLTTASQYPPLYLLYL